MTTGMCITCLGCGTTLRVAAEHAGRLLRCPRCSQTVRAAPAANIPVDDDSRARLGHLTNASAAAALNGQVDAGSDSTSASSPGSLAASLEPPAPVYPGAAPVAIGKMLGQYRLLKPLGRGGRGLVFEGEDVRIGRRVAVKIMAPEAVAGGSESLQRFLIEAKAASRIDHPNVVTVYNVGEELGVVFIAMSLIKGGSLQDRANALGRLPPVEATRIVKLAARGLAAVHAAGIVHRDIKPANIMLGEADEVKITDFGTAKMLDNSAASLTEPGMLIGTPHYMSPEQCLGSKIDTRVDIYSLGITYYRLLTGKLPYSDANSLAIARMQICEPHPDPQSIVPSLPGMCVRIINKAMEKDPSNRYQTAAAMADALETVEASLRQTESIHGEAEAAAERERTVDDDILARFLDDEADSEEIALPNGLGGEPGATDGRAAADDDPPTPPTYGRFAKEGPPTPPTAQEPKAAPRPQPVPVVNLNPGEDMAASGSGLFEPEDIQRAAAAEIAPVPPKPAPRPAPKPAPASAALTFGAASSSKSGRIVVAKMEGRAAESDFAESNKTKSNGIDARRLALPVEAAYTFKFPDIDSAKAALDSLRRDVRSVIRNKRISPAAVRGVRVAIFHFTATLSANEQLGLVKSFVYARGEYVAVTVEDHEIGDWLRRQVTLVRRS